VIGGLQDEAPAILVGDDAADLAPMPVAATTFYCAVARWYSLGRTGGGHGNPRWLEQGDQWVEQSSTGTPLGATVTRLPFPTSVVSDGSQVLITGFTQVLGGGEVRVRAAWIGAPTGPWERLDLSGGVAESRGDAATCDADGCVIVGHGDDALLAWRYVGGAATQLAVPDLGTPGDVVAPVIWNGSTTVLAPDVVAVSDDLAAWRLVTGAPGTPLAAATRGSALYVLVEADGGVALWRSV
jgi:hypothetical protein